MSAISVGLSERLGLAHAARGQTYVAAPVFGRPNVHSMTLRRRLRLASKGKIFSRLTLSGMTAAADPLLAAFIVAPRGQASLALMALFPLAGIAILIALVFSKFVYIAAMTNYYAFYLIDAFHRRLQTAQIFLFRSSRPARSARSWAAPAAVGAAGAGYSRAGNRAQSPRRRRLHRIPERGDRLVGVKSRRRWRRLLGRLSRVGRETANASERRSNAGGDARIIDVVAASGAARAPKEPGRCDRSRRGPGS
ncbi:MAG: hypothetical protein ACLPSF_03150 [Methylocella sp.]